MFKSSEIKNILEIYLKQGESKFIIYPFGENGQQIKTILNDFFGIEPVCIVDNHYSNYNRNIISFSDLVSKREILEMKDLFIIITVEDHDLNMVIEEDCLKFFKNEQIINVLRRVCTEITTLKYLTKEECVSFSAKSMLESFSLETNRKIKVRVLHHGARIWNAYQTVCESFRDDNRFDLLLLLCSEDDLAMKDQVAGYNSVYYYNYNPEADLPDIFIFGSSFVATFAKPISRVSKVSIMIQLVLDVYLPDKMNGVRQMSMEILESGCDYCLVEKQLYKTMKLFGDEKLLQNVKVLEFGNPKYDILYNLQESKNTFEFEKLKGKDKNILFATTHGCRNGRFWEGITFDIYFKTIVQFINNNKNIGLIFRPHPLFIRELVANNYWTADEVKNIKQYMESSHNMVWDDKPTYEEALKGADVIIVDGYCGMILSTFPLMKPISALYRNQDIEVICPELDQVLYSVRCEEELKIFLERVVNSGQDDMLEERKAGWQKFIKYFDGKNGQRIKEFIAEEYLNKYSF